MVQVTWKGNVKRTEDVGRKTEDINDTIIDMEKRLENLRVWNDARTLVLCIYEIMRDCHDYGFKDQIQRASVSIMNNIAEGFDAGSDDLFVRYLNIAKASSSEVKSMLYLCEDLGFCTIDKREELMSQLVSIAAQLSSLISFLKKK